MESRNPLGGIMNPFWVHIRVETYVGIIYVGLWSTPSLSCGVLHDIAKPLLECSSLSCMPFVLAPITKLCEESLLRMYRRKMVCQISMISDDDLLLIYTRTLLHLHTLIYIYIYMCAHTLCMDPILSVSVSHSGSWAHKR